MSDPCRQILDELGPSGPTQAGRDHAAGCPSCAALLEGHRKLGRSEAPATASLDRILAAALEELRRTPNLSWQRETLLLLLATAVLTLLVTFLPLWRESLPWSPEGLAVHTALLVLTQAILAFGAVAPGPLGRGAGFLGLGLTVASALSLAIGLPGSTLPAAQSGLTCSSMVLALAILPVVVGLWATRRAAPSRLRSGLVGLAAGAVGALALHLHCPNASLLHVAAFHLGAWALLAVVVGLGAPRWRQPLSFAP